MTKKNIKYFNHAKDVALMSEVKKCKLGCVVVLGNKILSVGFNTNRTHPIQQVYNRYRGIGGNETEHKLHSEIAALLQIRHLDINWGKVSVYIYRVCKGKDKKFGLARPCPSCLQMIKDLGIKTIHYTTDDGFVSEYIT